MSNKNHRSIDPTEAAYFEVFRHQPLLASDAANWDGIHLNYTRFLGGESQECYLTKPSLHIYTDVPPEFISDVRLNGKFQQQIVSEGHVAIAPPGVSVWAYEEQEYKGITLSFEYTLLARAASELVDLDRIESIATYPNKVDPLIHGIGLALKAELEPNRIGSRLYVEHLTTALSVHLLRNYCTLQPKIREYTDGLSTYRLKVAIDYIEAHLECNISLSDIASKLGINHYYFCRQFKQSTGTTPYQYLMQRRIARAKNLLKLKGSIAEISLQCGFADQNHLTRIFRKQVGTTPSNYRKQIC